MQGRVGHDARNRSRPEGQHAALLSGVLTNFAASAPPGIAVGRTFAKAQVAEKRAAIRKPSRRLHTKGD